MTDNAQFLAWCLRLEVIGTAGASAPPGVTRSQRLGIAFYTSGQGWRLCRHWRAVFAECYPVTPLPPTVSHLKCVPVTSTILVAALHELQYLAWERFRDAELVEMVDGFYLLERDLRRHLGFDRTDALHRIAALVAFYRRQVIDVFAAV